MLEKLLLGDLTMMAPSSAPLEAVSKDIILWDLLIYLRIMKQLIEF